MSKQMKTNWQTKKLGEVCDIKTGKKDVNEGNPNGKYPFFTCAREPTFSDSYSFNFEALLVAGNGDVGHVSYYKGKFEAYQRTYILSNFKNISVPFLTHVLKGTLKESVSKQKLGNTMPYIKMGMLTNFEIPLPPLPEQHRIVKILDEVFADVARAKENAEKNLQNAKALFESYLQSVFATPNDEWEERKLGDKNLFQIIDGDRGKNYPKKSDFLQEGYCLFLNTKNVRPDGFDFKTTMFVAKKKDEALGNGKLQRNDVLLTTRGTIGNIAVYDKNVPFENIRINSGMLIFRPNTKFIIPEYLFKIFQSGIMKYQIKRYVSGAAQPQLPIKTLVNFLIPVPKSLSEQKSIVSKLDALSKQTKKLEKIYQQKLADLEELKKSVLKRAFNGEL